MNKLADKIAVVTGGSKNLGRHISLELAKEGAYTIILSHDEALNSQVVSQIQKQGDKAEAHNIDLRDLEGLKKVFATILNKHKKVDTLVNNAGIAYFDFAKDIDEQKAAQSIDINLKAMYLACKLVLPSMLANKSGVIANISSLYGVRADKKTSIYSMTKFGIVGYTKGLDADYKEQGIRAKVFCPTAFGEDCILKTEVLAGEIVKSISDPHDRYNQVVVLSKKIGFIKVLLFIKRKWNWIGWRDLVFYKFKIC